MMTIEKAILIDLVNGLESLAVAVDSIEAILIRSNICSSDQFEAEKTQHLAEVQNRLKSVRTAIDSLI